MSEDFAAHWDSPTQLRIEGHFDASKAAEAEAALNQAVESTEVDCSRLAYISSAGIGALLAAHKRLLKSGSSLKLVKMNDHIRELFELAGFDMVFEMD